MTDLVENVLKSGIHRNSLFHLKRRITRPLGSGGAGGAAAPLEKFRGCAAPPGNFHEPPKGLKFRRKGSNIDVRTGAALFFCLSERLVMYDRRLVPPVCVWKIDQKKYEVEINVSEFFCREF